MMKVMGNTHLVRVGEGKKVALPTLFADVRDRETDDRVFHGEHSQPQYAQSVLESSGTVFGVVRREGDQ